MAASLTFEREKQSAGRWTALTFFTGYSHRICVRKKNERERTRNVCIRENFQDKVAVWKFYGSEEFLNRQLG